MDSNENKDFSSDSNLPLLGDIERLLSKLVINEETLERQDTLISTLDEKFHLVGRTFWAFMQGCDEYGLIVDLKIEGKDFYGEWILNDMYILWEHMHSEIRELSYAERAELVSKRLPIGTHFRSTVVSLINNSLLLVIAKMPDPRYITMDYSEETYVSKSKFRYLIVVDFESTCDYSPYPAVDAYSSEIIEFPWITIDTHTKEIIHKERHYVKPDNMSGITRYCTKLTGINQGMVKDSKSLREVVEIFNDYIETTFLKEHEDDFCILTDGIWDLNIQLFSEAKRKNIELKSWALKFIDLKREYFQTFPFFKYSPSLYMMLKSLRLNFVGKHHSGLDDCLSISQIVTELLNLGSDFSRTENIDVSLDPFEDPRFVDFGSVAEPTSWMCFEKECRVYNRPWSAKCRFCGTPKRDYVST